MPFTRKAEFTEWNQQGEAGPAVAQKNISLLIRRKSLANSWRPVPNEGRFAIVTNVERDAVDATALLTNGARADGEVVWS